MKWYYTLGSKCVLKIEIKRGSVIGPYVFTPPYSSRPQDGFCGLKQGFYAFYLLGFSQIHLLAIRTHTLQIFRTILQVWVLLHPAIHATCPYFNYIVIYHAILSKRAKFSYPLILLIKS